jgi:hypothetical protein
MNLRALLSIPLGISSFFTKLPAIRYASTMTLDAAKMNGIVNYQGDGWVLMVVLNEPLQPLTTESDPSHPTGFFRDGYCWGSPQDPGKHYIGAVVTDQFLQYSKEKGMSISPLQPQATRTIWEGM